MFYKMLMKGALQFDWLIDKTGSQATSSDS